MPGGTGVNTSDPTFCTAGRDLMLDLDSNGAGAAVRAARIHAGGTIAAGDFEVHS